jgi:hypothetical protein
VEEVAVLVEDSGGGEVVGGREDVVFGDLALIS